MLNLGKRQQTLVGIASSSLGDGPADIHGHGPRARELQALLRVRNGFFAFESALRVFPAGRRTIGPSLEAWNAPSGWREDYRSLADGCLFFAEDLFGGQFAIKDDAIVSFDPETGEAELMAGTLEEWADRILNEFAVLTGHPLARQWQQSHGPLPAGMRLIPKVPFVLGGEFDVSNLEARDGVESMRTRASLAMRIHGLSDGASIHYEIAPTE